MPSLVRRILTSTDFSRISLRAVDYAARIAGELGAELIVVYVEDPTYVLPGEVVSTTLAKGVLEQADRAAKHELDRLCQRLATSGQKVTASILEGSAADRILEAAAQSGADWIVMGTHGRTGSAHAFLGSVTERVAREASCPVLIVPGREAPQSER